MNGTADLRTAYNGNMEMLIVAFVLAYAEKDEDFKKSLRQTLAFYRENKELLKAFLGRSEEQEAERETEKAPSDAGESFRILDEFLKKL